jgi:diacylglycerol kinase (ATP)
VDRPRDRDTGGTNGGIIRRRALIIVNPAAGGSRRTQRLLAKLVAALARRGCDAIVRVGAEEGDVERLAREAEADFDVIVAAGGDGTIGAVANGAAASGRVVALLPCGTANVLAHEIGLPRRPDRLAALIVEGRARAVWPGRVAGRLFLTTASSGFDAEIVAAVSPRLKRRFGRLAFAWAILVRLWRYREHALVVRVDGAEHRAAAAIATTGRCYAGPFVIAPGADLGEPMLVLVLFRRAGRLAVIRYLAALLLGRLPGRRDVTLLRCRAAALSSADSIPVQADGDIVAQLPVSIAIADAPLWLVRP